MNWLIPGNAIQVETGSAITWKYPSVVLKGDGSSGEFYSVALTNNKQQADTGTKMIHIGQNTRSRIVSKGISAGNSVNAYRYAMLVVISPVLHFHDNIGKPWSNSYSEGSIRTNLHCRTS